MNTLKKISAALILFCMSCNKGNNSKTVLTESEIPSKIVTFKNQNFPDKNITKAVRESNLSTTSYDISLSDAIELEFDQSLNIVTIDAQSKLPNSVIPNSILEYVAQNFPNNIITDWEIENNYQEVELDNQLELEFRMDGTFIRIDTDENNESEIVLTANQIPSEIKDFQNLHFSNESIRLAVKEVDGAKTTYEISITGHIELEFNEKLEIIGIDSKYKLSNSVVPNSILDYVSQNYPNNFIVEWELERTHQQVELNNQVDLEFAMDGTFLRIDKD